MITGVKLESEEQQDLEQQQKRTGILSLLHQLSFADVLTFSRI
jgi:hypothetical protein